MIRQGQQWPCLFSVECTCNQGGGGYLEDEFISAAKLIPEPNRSPMTQDWGYGFRSGLKEGKPDYDGFPKATGVVENYSAGHAAPYAGISLHSVKFFRQIEKALFLERPNRFTLLCRRSGKVVKVYLPNPGRMWELLLPGTIVYLEKTSPTENKMDFTAVAVEKEGYPVMVHTHRTNDLANELLEKDLIPGLEGAEVIKREVKEGRSRFDFFLKKGEEKIFLEVKSCTLFGRRIAMFPDAVTARGKRHIEELADLSRRGAAGAVLFLIFWPHAEFFMPEYHTDLEFARALLTAREKISIIPLAVELRDDLSLTSKVRFLEVPWNTVKKEAEDRGSYILVLRLREKARIEVGKLGGIGFRKGYYLYIGSARKDLSRRIERHRRMRKKYFWHIDSLRGAAEFCHALPIRTHDILECEVARAVKKISDWEVPRFGSSDCSCPSHLYGMTQDPLHSAKFISLLQYFRMDRLIGENIATHEKFTYKTAKDKK